MPSTSNGRMCESSMVSDRQGSLATQGPAILVALVWKGQPYSYMHNIAKLIET